MNLDWAQRHLDVLGKHIRAFEKPNNVSVRTYRNMEGRRTWMVETKNGVDPDWGHIAGDALHNMRVALDSLAWQLALTVKSNPSRLTAFPIRSNPCGWDKLANGPLRHIPEKAREYIKGLQPDDGGHRDHSLWVLNAFDNAHKHRTTVAASVLFDPQNAPRRGDTRYFDSDGVEYTTAVYDDKFKPKFRAYVSFENTILDGTDRVTAAIPYESLVAIHESINDEVFPKFEEFFS